MACSESSDEVVLRRGFRVSWAVVVRVQIPPHERLYRGRAARAWLVPGCPERVVRRTCSLRPRRAHRLPSVSTSSAAAAFSGASITW